MSSGIALQLYTVRDAAMADPLGTLRAIAEAGYRAAEFAGLYDLPAATIRAELDRLEMRAIGAHVSLPALTDSFDATVADLQTLGCDYATMPHLKPEQRPTSRDGLLELTEKLNGWGSRMRSAGLRFGYHNHDFEFARIDDETMFDLMIANTDPALVDIQLDVYWAAFAGHDPIALIKRLSGRVPLLHVKDMEFADGGQRDAPVGEGVIDWRPVITAGQACGTQWYIVEQDHPRNPMRDVAASLENLTALFKG